MIPGPCKALLDAGGICGCAAAQYNAPTADNVLATTCLKFLHLLTLHDGGTEWATNLLDDPAANPLAQMVSEEDGTALSTATPVAGPRPPPIDLQPTGVPVLSQNVTPRDRLVKGLYKHVMEKYVVHIIGTPMTGKTILSRLLKEYAGRHHPETTTVRFEWRLDGGRGLHSAGYVESICQMSNGSITPSDFDFPSEPILIIVDDAHLSYTNQGFWNGLVQLQATDNRKPNLHIVLLSSWGSASDKALNVPGSAPITLSADRRMDLMPQGALPKSLALFFDFSDVEDVGRRMLQDTDSKLNNDAVDYIYRESSGHAGLTVALLKSLLDHSSVQRLTHEGSTITLETALSCLGDESGRKSDIEARIKRSIPSSKSLQTDAELVKALEKAVSPDGISCRDVLKVPGLTAAYKAGYLHVSYHSSEKTQYAFPTSPHQSCVQRKLCPPTAAEVPYNDIRELCWAALKKFNPTSLVKHKKHNAESTAHCPEAQYGHELYRCLYELLKGEISLQVEFSYTAKGRVDLYIPGKRWAIELLRDGVRMKEHLDRFHGGAYDEWGDIIKHHILLNFCTKRPSDHEYKDPDLYHVIFTADHKVVEVIRSTDKAVQLPCTRLLYQ